MDRPWLALRQFRKGADQRQFVIKNLDKNFHAVDGVAGATIMGNGQVALIIDIDRVVAKATTRVPVDRAA